MTHRDLLLLILNHAKKHQVLRTHTIINMIEKNIRPHEKDHDLLTNEEIHAYSEFLDACDDDCDTVIANKLTQSAVLKLIDNAKRI